MVSVNEVNSRYGYWEGNILKMSETVMGKMYLPQSEPDSVWHHWETRTTDNLAKYVKHDSNFMDVGANFGYFVLDAARTITDGQMWALEPNPFVYAILELNMQLHELRNVHTCKVALTNGSEKFINFFWYDGANGFGRSYDPSAYNLNTWKRYTVRAYGLDAFANTELDIIKIDIEGGEYEAILHADKFYDTHSGTIIMMDLHYEYISQYKGEKASRELAEFIDSHFDVLTSDQMFCVLRI